MQVFFVGTEAKIDMRPSSVWLKEKTAHWSFKKHLKIGVKRDEALEILSSEGTLLVLCSLIDNMPYVVAEAAVSFSALHPPSFRSAGHECSRFVHRVSSASP